MTHPENTLTPATNLDALQSVSGTSGAAGTSIEGEAAVAVAPAALASPPPPARCKNCQAILTGRYCAACGQRADVHMPSTRELVHEALEGLTHSDSRLWRTLLLLWFRPGTLTEEFLAGRRAISLPPFRLSLVISVK